MSLGIGNRGSEFEFGIGYLQNAFYPLYDRLFDESDPFVSNLDEKLAEARIDRTVEMYLSRALAISTVTGLLFWLGGVVIGLSLVTTGVVGSEALTGVQIPNETVLSLVRTLRVPFLVALSGILFGSLGFGSVFGVYVVVPYSRAAKRKREINRLLPDAVSFMYALSVGGMSQLEILEAMAAAEDTYGEVAREFRTIVQETEYFDTDYRSAISKRAARTPSDEFGQFLMDMLSIINSGGNMTDFLDDKTELHFRTAKEQQERTLETLELFGEMYITLSLFPLLLVVILVIMNLMGRAQMLVLYATVYGIIPLTSTAFLILISTVKQDEIGDGYLRRGDDAAGVEDNVGGPLNLGLIDRFSGDGSYYVFDRIRDREGTHEIIQSLKRPDLFFRDNPFYTLAITVPVVLVYLVTVVVSGYVPVSWEGVLEYPLWTTLNYAYVPLFVTCLPLAIFWEWNVRSRRTILGNLSETLRKLSSANATGLTFLESIRTITETSSGKLSEEFRTIYAKSSYGMDLKSSLIVFNNKYHIPRLARTVNLIARAHETSNQISTVLSTAAKATETQDDLERERQSRSRMQVVIILMTFLTMLGVMAVLKTQFVDVMTRLTEQTGGSRGVAGGFGGGMDTSQLSLLFFHAVTIQAVLSGLICGYIRDARLASGLKYVVALLIVSLGVWVVVG